MDDLSKPGKTNIAERMRALAAQRDDLPDNWDELADKVDAATDGFFAKPQTHNVMQFMGCMARARRAWCDATGEPLV